LNRDFILIEKNIEYFEIINKRLNKIEIEWYIKKIMYNYVYYYKKFSN
jgi:DNA modification methylase